MSRVAQIRQTMASTTKTKKITGTMKLVAMSKVSKAERLMASSRPYAEKMQNVIAHVSQSHSEYRHPFLMERPNHKRVGIIVVSSDRGLCGGLNIQLFKEILLFMKEQKKLGKTVELGLIGNKAIQFFKHLDVDVVADVRRLPDKPSLMDMVGVVQAMLNRYEDGELGSVYVGYNRFTSMMTQTPLLSPLLPIVLHKHADESKQDTYWDYLYEPDAPSVLDVMLKRYIESQVYQSVVENMASEHAARMMAMDSATKNAEEVIESLRLIYNKARQAQITQELSEIVAGADAV
jgi:F-type H+-transporting ATPase subunit gamma